MVFRSPSPASFLNFASASSGSPPARGAGEAACKSHASKFSTSALARTNRGSSVSSERGATGSSESTRLRFREDAISISSETSAGVFRIFASHRVARSGSGACVGRSDRGAFVGVVSSVAAETHAGPAPEDVCAASMSARRRAKISRNTAGQTGCGRRGSASSQPRAPALARHAATAPGGRGPEGSSAERYDPTRDSSVGKRSLGASGNGGSLAEARMCSDAASFFASAPPRRRRNAPGVSASANSAAKPEGATLAPALARRARTDSTASFHAPTHAAGVVVAASSVPPFASASRTSSRRYASKKYGSGGATDAIHRTPFASASLRRAQSVLAGSCTPRRSSAASPPPIASTRTATGDVERPVPVRAAADATALATADSTAAAVARRTAAERAEFSSTRTSRGIVFVFEFRRAARTRDDANARSRASSALGMAPAGAEETPPNAGARRRTKSAAEVEAYLGGGASFVSRAQIQSVASFFCASFAVSGVDAKNGVFRSSSATANGRDAYSERIDSSSFAPGRALRPRESFARTHARVDLSASRGKVPSPPPPSPSPPGPGPEHVVSFQCDRCPSALAGVVPASRATASTRIRGTSRGAPHGAFLAASSLAPSAASAAERPV
mmetsp:Transcript_7763/g.32385  ORF Transcript_7763/g.32385 Transcript_7763/m.32385 type:complete len:620 (+) Transcript_7763:72-1931(+)